MVSVKRIIVAALVVIIGVFAARYIFQSEERKVKKRFNLLSDWVSKDVDEDNFTMTRKTLGIGTLFAGKCILKTHIHPIAGSRGSLQAGHSGNTRPKDIKKDRGLGEKAGV